MQYHHGSTEKTGLLHPAARRKVLVGRPMSKGGLLKYCYSSPPYEEVSYISSRFKINGERIRKGNRENLFKLANCPLGTSRDKNMVRRFVWIDLDLFRNLHCERREVLARDEAQEG